MEVTRERRSSSGKPIGARISDMRIATRALSWFLLPLAAVSLLSCRALVKDAFKAPKVRVIDVDFAGAPPDLEKDRWDFTLRLAIDNRNPYPLQVVSVGYCASVGNAILADGERTDEVRIGASGETVVPVPLTLRPEAFKEAARSVIEARALSYEFNGSVGIRAPVVGVLRIPFSRTGKIEPMDILKRKGLRFK